MPVPRAPGDVIGTPAQKRRERKAQASAPKGKGKPREPKARGKWLTASVTGDIPAVVTAAFGEAGRRDPAHQREWVVLADGNATQIEAAAAEAARRGVTVTIVIDFIHVPEYPSAPRGALPYPPRSGERLEGISLDLMAYPALKGQPGKIACQKTGERAQAYGTRCRGIRAIWRKLNCLKPNLQKMQFEHLPERRLKPAPPLRQDPDVPAASPGRGTMPCQGIQGDERAA